MANVKRASVRRVAVRDYGPWIGLILSLGIVIAMVGDADAIRLIAAWAFVRSARLLTGLKMLPSLRKRLTPEDRLPPDARRLAVIGSAGGLLAAFAITAGIAALLLAAGQDQVALLCAILALGLPPRYLLALGLKRRVLFTFRAVANWGGLALLLTAWLLGGSLLAAAVAFALRDWLGLAAALLAAPRMRIRRRTSEPLLWSELAASTALQSRRRLSYRLGKGLLTILFGPVGALSARIGRSARVHHRMEPFIPNRPVALLALALGSAGAAALLILAVPAPATLAVAGSFTMVAAVAANILLLGVAAGAVDDGDEDEEDEA